MLIFFATFVMQMNNSAIIYRFIKRKVATTMFIMVSLAAFATLGEGIGRKSHKESLLSTKANPYDFKSFSLKSGYNYRGNKLCSVPSNRYIMLNTTVTYQKGNYTYILPLKGKILLDKVKFSPSPLRF